MSRSLALAVLLCAFGAAGAERPDLVVVISVDQLRFDLADTYAPWMTTRGFRRFLDQGAVFTNARYRHAVTCTGPGHATIGTGRIPAEHGIIGNNWFERDGAVDAKMWEWYFDDITPYRAPGIAETPFTAEGDWWWKEGGSPRYCVYDDRVVPSAGKTSGMSPMTLADDALGDVVKAKYPDARVIAVAYKDRASILMGGRRADAAYWFDTKLPGFISSSYYRYSAGVLAFNQLVPGYIPGSAQWKPSPYIPEADLTRVTFDPPAAWPLKNNTYSGTFPHPIANYKALTYTPFAHDLLLDFALHTIDVERLGTRHGTPDLFFVGISSTDYVGHYYGPESREVADSMVRLDRALAAFLDALERRFGERVVVALTADHGVQSNPEIVKLRDPGADVGRVDVRTPDAKAKRIADLPPVRIEIERALANKLGTKFETNAPLTYALVYFFEEPAFYLNWKRIAALGLDGEKVKRALRDIVAGMKQHGFAAAWTSTELLTPNPRASREESLMRNSFRSDRAGDVLMALRPGWLWAWGSNSTTHGQPVENDLHVPLMFWGASIRKGRHDIDAAPTDLAPTLGALLGVRAGGREGRVLEIREEDRRATNR